MSFLKLIESFLVMLGSIITYPDRKIITWIRNDHVYTKKGKGRILSILRWINRIQFVLILGVSIAAGFQAVIGAIISFGAIFLLAEYFLEEANEEEKALRQEIEGRDVYRIALGYILSGVIGGLFASAVMTLFVTQGGNLFSLLIVDVVILLFMSIFLAPVMIEYTIFIPTKKEDS